MKKRMVLVLVTMLVLGTCSIALASGNGKPNIKEETVDLIVKVAEWATISQPQAMELDLTEPGKYYSTSQDITVGTNTNVTVNVSQPGPDDSNSALLKAIDAGAFDWGLGFQGEPSASSYLSDSFEVNTGTEVKRELTFWAEWKEDKWWTLPADNYQGTATITVYAR
jgi:hypothetical protein